MRCVKWAAIALNGTGLLLLVLIFGWPQTAPGQVTLQVTGIRPAATNILQVSVTLSNVSSRSFNIVDAVDGHPSYVIQPDANLGPKYGFALARLANSLKLNLTPGAILADTFYITNPPPRFRVSVPIRDPSAENTVFSGIKSNLVSSRLGQTLEDLEIVNEPEPEPRFSLAAKSGWVESGLRYVPVASPRYTNWFGLVGGGVIGTPDKPPDFMLGGAINASCRAPAEAANSWHVYDSLNKLLFNATNIVVVQCGHLPGSLPDTRSRKPPVNFIDFSGDATLKGATGNPTNFGTVSFTARAVALGGHGRGADQFYLRVYSSTGQVLLLISATPSTPEAISPVPIRDSDFHILNCEH